LVVTVVELTSYLETDLVFSRGETPAFRLEFTGTTGEEVAGWDLSADIRRTPLSDPIATFDVTVDDTDVTFSLTTDVTDTLPDHTTYAVRLVIDNSVRLPMGGRLILRSSAC
jgi:hypothetical protein